MIDPFARQIDYLRVSVTDRCNFRCVYCMPVEGVPFQPLEDALTAGEITLIVEAGASLGICRVRLTGGEPLVRRDIVEIVAAVREGGIQEISLTTNGQRLPEMAEDLASAGLSRINISLDTLDPLRFQKVARGGDLATVWRGIEAALRFGLDPVKVNCVVMRGVNDHEAADFAALTVDRPLHVRFIELMPMGETHLKVREDRILWQGQVGKVSPVRLKGCWDNTSPGLEGQVERDLLDTAGLASTAELYVPLSEIRHRVETLGPLTPADVPTAGPARNYRLPGAKGTVGFISQISNTACATCNRMRVTPDGKLRPCLMNTGEVDLRGPLRNGADINEIRRLFLTALGQKPFEHDLERGRFADDRAMSQIGG